MCWLTDLLARSKWEQMKKEARNRSWGWMDIEKIKDLDKGSDSQFSMCVNPLMLQVLSFNPSTFCSCQLLMCRPLSSCAMCVYVCVFLSSIMSISSSLSKCQSKLLLFPDHAVGDRPTSSPWQPSVLAQRERQGWRRKELLCLWTPTSFLISPHPFALYPWPEPCGQAPMLHCD